MSSGFSWPWLALAIFTSCTAAWGDPANTLPSSPAETRGPVAIKIDPVTRYIHISYAVPPSVDEEIVVVCSWSPIGKEEWRPAPVAPDISQTGLNLVRSNEWEQWRSGRIVERRAAGLVRTLVFRPYPDAEEKGIVNVDFRIQIESPAGQVVDTRQFKVMADNRDVLYVEDWSKVLQQDFISKDAEAKNGIWHWRTGMPASSNTTFGNALYGKSDPVCGLPQLTYPLDLRGTYAVFFCTLPGNGQQLRFSGDERADTCVSPQVGFEQLWKWRRMDRQNLILKQMHFYNGWSDAHIDYVKFVPLADQLVQELDAPLTAKVDKLFHGYWEPYSWAFIEKVDHMLQHREPLTAFAEGRIAMADMQVGRFGDKSTYETRKTDSLVHEAIGDPIGTVERPETNNAGRMQQYTNTLETGLRYARELGIQMFANFGASACYTDTPLQGEFSKKHPEWKRGDQLRFEVPEVQEYALMLYREVLEIGAPGISIDFCRYPECIDKVETCNEFLRKLRQLRDEFGKARGQHVPISIRFPAKGVRLYQLFDYPTWIREKLVDYLCPSNIQGRHMHFEFKDYVEAVRGSGVKLLPCLDGLSWGQEMPGPFLWRVGQLYDAGADGIYLYQADSRVMSRRFSDSRCVRLVPSSESVNGWLKEDAARRPARSKGIYLVPHLMHGGYHFWERLRFWPEGVPLGEAEVYLDDKLVNKCDGPPYLLGTEEYESDHVIPAGEHQLKIRVKDGDGWLEQTFTITGAK